MKLKPTLRKTAELGISLTALTTLILTGCGGGSGGSSSTSNNNTTVTAAYAMKVTPGKGIMIGANVSVANNNGANVLVSGTTSSTGTVTLSVPGTATGPFVVSVTCPATCQYFDEKTGQMVTGTANARPMLAIVPTAALLDIGVTAATNAAAQYALGMGALTASSVAEANATVASTLGLGISSTDILTPPTIISDAATASSVQAGATLADKLANYSAALTEAASGVSALDAIADYGAAWQAVAASNVALALPTTIDPAVITAVAPAIPVVPISASTIAASAAAATSAVSAATTAAADLLSDGASTGVGNWHQNTYYANAAAMASGVSTTDVLLRKSVITATATANAYTVSSTALKLVNGSYVSNTDPRVFYMLDTAGWVLEGSTTTVTNNLDGTLTVTDAGMSPRVDTMARTDLSGTPIPCSSNAPATCSTATYPTGAALYTGTPSSSVMQYELTSGTTQYPATVTDMNGVALTALPTNISFCVSFGGQPGGNIFVPTSGNTFSVYGTWSCSATDIAGAGVGLVTPQDTVTLGVANTGNTAVPQVGVASGATVLTYLNNTIIAVRAGVVYPGSRYLNSADISTKNKTAVSAELQANGYPALP